MILNKAAFNDNRLQVYNASAGSGKTFQIAKEYLMKIILSKDAFFSKHLLGITFTNKAAGEMKQRILSNLITASKGDIAGVMQAVAEDLRKPVEQQTGKLTDEQYRQEIINRSQKRLQEILHYYDDFQLTTIDKLMYRIIKTFARDLQLPSDFDVILDEKETVSNLIDLLINEAKPGSELSKFLINLAKTKVDDEKHWDIKGDLLTITDLIFNEDFYDKIESISDKSLKDFSGFKKLLYQKKQSIIADFKDKYLVAITKITNENKELNNNYRKKIEPFIQYPDRIPPISFTDKQLANIEGEAIFFNKPYYQTNGSETDRFIAGFFLEWLQKQRELQLIQDLIFNTNTLSIQNELLKRIENFKEEQHSIFIKDFNKLIFQYIAEDFKDNAPYIFMRLGEKYAHYFIDEFQDTSELQWKNLIPLIDEALSKSLDNDEQSPGDAMLVGDAKQSIYRFRGGKPEQFIALTDPADTTADGNPFNAVTGKQVHNLPFNWRSKAHIIKFNNLFFKSFPDYLGETYQKVYQNPEQQIPEGRDTDEGYVQVRFLQKDDKTNGTPKETYNEAVYHSILQAENSGFKREEICILVDRNKHGIQIADYLLENDIPVISSETLLVGNAEKVQFLLAWFRFLHYGNTENFYPIVKYIALQKELDNEALYARIFKEKKLSKKQRIELLKETGYSVDYELLMQLGLYELSVYLIQVFQLEKTPVEQAYLQAFMEEIHHFTGQAQGHIKDFLNHWELKGEKLSIDAPERNGAVRMMTVHKSKGLEFPVVIYYTNGELLSSRDLNKKVWVPLPAGLDHNFKMFPVSLKVLQLFENHPAYQPYYKKASDEIKFDNLNKLYVAMTRASEQLFVILNPLPKELKDTRYNFIFDKFLKQNGIENNGNIYHYGNPQRQVVSDKPATEPEAVQLFYNSRHTEQNNMLKINTLTYERWSEDKKNAIDYGMLLHQILSQITSMQQWQTDRDKLLANIPADRKEIVKTKITQILSHPQLKSYFTDSYQVLNERSILIPDRQQAFVQKRPDRLLLQDNQAIIIDYKTGAPHTYHARQLEEYAALLQDVGFDVKERLLVYIGDEITVKAV